MFLPVLLVRDLGFWSWVAFATPNVLGAAAMGWVLRRGETSARMVQAHRPACDLFSLVTIAFHVHFVTWLGPRLIGAYAPVLFALLLAAFWFAGLRNDRRDLVTAVAVSLLSLLLLALVGLEEAASVARLPQGWNPQLTYVLPVFLLGFLACPYLDMTFHRARQDLSRPAARWAFSLGFGGVFLLMIAGTLLYSALLAELSLPIDEPLALGLPIVAALAIHLLMQGAFTSAVHLRELLHNEPAAARLTMMRLGLVVMLTLLVQLLHRRGWVEIPGMDHGEAVYRYFLTFYGLVFPAYVWICLLPMGGGSWQPPSRAQVWICVATILLALPWYALAFLRGQYVWLLLGVGLVLLARWPAWWWERRARA